jgi:hypothetical protein
MSRFYDGPASPAFRPLPFQGNTPLSALGQAGVSARMAAAAAQAPSGAGTAWGIPFEIGDALVLKDSPVSVPFGAADSAVAADRFLARWLVFMHTSDLQPMEQNASGFVSPMRGEGRLGEVAATYVICYEDGTEVRAPIRRRFAVGGFQKHWGENCFESVLQHKPFPMHAEYEQVCEPGYWGVSQTRVGQPDEAPWLNWLWAWENPYPEKAISGVRCEPGAGVLVISAISAGDVAAHPLRWGTRRKALLALPEGTAFDPRFDENGLLAQIQLDMGQVISARARLSYPDETWADSYNNQVPTRPAGELVIEYAAHPEAHFHVAWGEPVPAQAVEAGQGNGRLRPVRPATQRVTLRTVEAGSGRPVAVKLHVHGAAGEYLAPIDRHRIPNPAWFQDYSTDFVHRYIHPSTYIPGETVIDLPLGRVYVEVSKGFEVRPVRTVVEVGQDTEEIVLTLDKVLPWREKGWVTADTHVHFLSPITAMLEGAGEGVNVVNLLASQWGELMTNVGDFDGRNTWGERETGGDGEYLVRVGTENRQHVLGHISLLGYQGRIIAPMTNAGPDEAALGDPVDMLLTEWARQCHRQQGLVVLPHFPYPRAEHAASIVSGDIDAIEMTSWGNLYSGIDPYSLSDWYRYLNCGYLVAAVGGTDKMTASTAVGTVRTYAHLALDMPFTYAAWMDAVRRAETFVSYGPLLEFAVDGKPMGSRLALPPGGGTVDVTWQVASVTVPVSRVELVVNGEIRESATAGPEGGAGQWRVRVDRSSWLALLVRGHYADKPEMIAAHSSPVMAAVEGTQFFAAADAVTILDQIEGALAYLDTVGTRAEDRAYKRTRLVLEAAHRTLHNRLHEQGYYHDHNVMMDHHAG